MLWCVLVVWLIGWVLVLVWRMGCGGAGCLGFCLILCSWLLIFAFRCGGSCVGLYLPWVLGFFNSVVIVNSFCLW